MPSSYLPISALPEIRELLDGAEQSLKADISRIKKLLADPAATLPPSIVAFTLQEAKDALNLLAAHSRQLNRWQKDSISARDLAEVKRLQTIIPEIRPLIQRLIAPFDRTRQTCQDWCRVSTQGVAALRLSQDGDRREVNPQALPGPHACRSASI